jgi:putative (di)nucleoside polyphosphate hydrolase
MSDLPYRPNVGALLFNPAGLVLVARRADLPNAEGAPGGWQLPQGGMDDGEDPAVAVLRELEEEVGTRNAVLLAEHPEWLRYDLPAHLIGVALGGRYRGQAQKWFAMRFLGEDSEIRLDLDPHPNSTPGAGPGSPSCPPWRCRSSGPSMSGWRQISPT